MATMTPEQAARHLQVIRELMERPLRQTTRSGASGIIAGVLALAGSGVSWHLTGGTIYASTENMPLVGAVWLGVLVLATGANLLLTWRRARGLGCRRYWGREQWQTALAIAPGFALGAVTTWMLAGHFEYGLIVMFWMIFYGMAVWSVGLFSPVEVKMLGAAFILAGALGSDWIQSHEIAAMAVTFGGFHLVYGVVVWARHGG
ncbi:MAG: hypothetical protein JXL80_14930 [Planctomycetes bacterium]|nr:hypothetical protein [Planctomycetota bacterium]